MNNIILFGPPGTGKTTHLLNIVEKALEDGMLPEQIAFVSFTTKAAFEARDRAVAKFKLNPDRFKYFRTIHSMALGQLGYTKDRIMGPSNWHEVQELSCVEFSGRYDMEGKGGTSADGDRILQAMGVARHRITPPEEGYRFLHADIGLRIYKKVVGTLTAYKADLGLIDFTDMLEHALGECDPIDIKMAIIDEAQDLSLLQWKVCEKLLANAGTTYVAGDDDQAIYRWSGAAVDYFQQLEGERLVLGTTYRFGKNIHELAERVSGKIKDRVPKDWAPKDGEPGNIQYVTQATKAPLSNGEPWLVLMRVNYQLGRFSARLKHAGIPHTLYGKSTVKEEDIAAITAWKALQAGESITPPQVRLLYDKLRGNGKQVRRGFKNVSELPEEILFDHEMLCEHHGLIIGTGLDWWDILNLDKEDIRYYRKIESRGKSFGDAALVNVCTIHAVKGGECDNVLLFTNITGKIHKAINADSEALDDEHRVFYVGITRARKTLYICRSNSSRFTYKVPMICSTDSLTSDSSSSATLE